MPQLRTVIAVVKWFHRRALVTLAHHAPSVERLFAAAYEPYDPVTGKLLRRSTWEGRALEASHRRPGTCARLSLEGSIHSPEMGEAGRVPLLEVRNNPERIGWEVPPPC